MDGYVLSDIHMDKVVSGDQEDLHLTRFIFSDHHLTCVCEECAVLVQPNQAVFDEDGDYVKPALPSRDCDVIRIFHRMSTDLTSVGLQVWRGALLACDYIVHNRVSFAGKHVLELGSGTGLAGIVAGKYAKSITCSDTGNSVLRLCRLNVAENSRHFSSGCQVSVEDLDWFSKFDISTFTTLPHIIVIADCIYDNDLTDALFRTLFKFMVACSNACVGTNQRYAIIALEKRLNFTLEDLDVTCLEYDHFRTCLTDLTSHDRFSAEQISVKTLPQYFEYDRTKYVEIWKIDCFKSNQER